MRGKISKWGGLLLPWLVFFALLSWNLPQIANEIRLGLDQNVSDLRYILSFWAIISVALGLIAVWGSPKYLPSQGMVAGTVLAIIYSINGLIFPFILVLGYMAGLFFGTKMLLRRKMHPIEIGILAIWLDFLITVGFYSTGIGTGLYPFLVSIFGIGVLAWTVKTHPENWIGLMKATGNHRVELLIQYALIALVLIVAGLLTLQPILEWDSSVGHLPMLRYYFYGRTLYPSPFITQSQFIDFGHVLALPLMSLAGNFGLKLNNFFFICVSAFSFICLSRSLKSTVVRDTPALSEIVVLLIAMTSPLVLTTAGTLQYDTELIFPALAAMFFLVRYISSPDLDYLPYLMALALGAGVLIKITFAFFAVPFALVAIPYVVRRRHSLVGPALILIATGMIIPIKFFIGSGASILELIQTTSAGANVHGEKMPYLKKLVTFIPKATFQANNYVEAAPFSLGFGPLAGLLCGLWYLMRKSRFIFPILIFGICLLAVAIALTQMQYVRYLVFVLLPLQLLIVQWLEVAHRENLRMKRFVIAGLILVLLIQISLVPRLNWWVKVPGQALVLGNYNEQKFRDDIRGSSWKDWIIMVQSLPDKGTLFISPTFAFEFFWLGTIDGPKQIVPSTWQSNLGKLLDLTGVDFLRAAKSMEFTTFVVPTAQTQAEIFVKKREALDRHCLRIWATDLYSSWADCHVD